MNNEAPVDMHLCTGGGSTLCDPRRPTRPSAPTCAWPNGQVDDPAPPSSAATIPFAEALALVGVSRNTLYRLAAEGEIPGAQRLGKTWRFHHATLLHFLAHPELYRRRRR